MRTGVRGRDHASVSRIALLLCLALIVLVNLIPPTTTAAPPRHAWASCPRATTCSNGSTATANGLIRRGPDRHEGAEPARRPAGPRHRRGLCGLPGRRHRGASLRGGRARRPGAAGFGRGGPMDPGAGDRLCGPARLEGAADQARGPHADPPGDDRQISRRHARRARRGAAGAAQARPDGRGEGLFRRRRAQARRADLRIRARSSSIRCGASISRPAIIGRCRASSPCCPGPRTTTASRS